MSNSILNRDDRRTAGATVIPDGITDTAASPKYRDKHRENAFGNNDGQKGNAETCRRGPLRRCEITCDALRDDGHSIARGFLYVPRSVVTRCGLTRTLCNGALRRYVLRYTISRCIPYDALPGPASAPASVRDYANRLWKSPDRAARTNLTFPADDILFLVASCIYMRIKSEIKSNIISMLHSLSRIYIVKIDDLNIYLKNTDIF